MTHMYAVLVRLPFFLVGLALVGLLAACSPDIPPTATTSPETDREALVALYHATDGPNWRNNGGWLSNAPIGEWYGVGTKEGRVARLFLGGNGLSGEIPPELGNLTKVYILYLEYNDLRGEIPAELGNLPKMRDLQLGHNELSGDIPPELGNLFHMEVLNLESNELSGEVPRELGDLVNLYHLVLRDNELSGEIPRDFGNMISLVTLDFNNNDWPAGV